MIQFLALMADLYTPLLLVASLFLVFKLWRNGDKSAALQLVLIAACTYSFMFIDKLFNLWAIVELDYSTHTAAALGLVFFISMRVNVISRLCLILSLLSYALLIKYLNYHSLADIFSTASAVLPFYIAIIYYIRSHRHTSSPH